MACYTGVAQDKAEVSDDNADHHLQDSWTSAARLLYQC